jgi:hypothetical protein
VFFEEGSAGFIWEILSACVCCPLLHAVVISRACARINRNILMKIRVVRRPESWEYRHRGPDAWHSQDANNSIDAFEVYGDAGRLIMHSFCQTVANAEGLIADVHEYDTIMPGPFKIRAFVEPREFKCEPHGIVGATTKHGDLIGEDSTTLINKSRWLIHDWKNHSEPPIDTRVAWSAGCIILKDEDLDSFNTLLAGHGIAPGDIIEAELL